MLTLAASTRVFLHRGVVDHRHMIVSPIILGRGVRLWDGQEGLETRFAHEAAGSPSGVVHHVFTRRPR